jgi:putative ABC transport system permease protein
MNFWIILKVALRSLRRTLLRSALTALGVIIGVASVIAMVSLGNGARAQIEKQFSTLDSNMLTFQAMPPRDQWRVGRMMRPKLPPGETLTIDDYNAVRNEVPGIAAASVLMTSLGGSVKANGRGAEATVSGIDVGAFDIFSNKILAGSVFGEADVQSAASVCIINETLSKDLFTGRDPIGRLVRIRDVPFVIVGVVADRDTGQTGQPPMGELHVPYTSLIRRLERAAAPSIALKAANPAELSRIESDVRDLLERRRGKRTSEFYASNVAEQVKSFKESTRTMTLLLGAIGGISLLVGGIGIMNIMLVSVTERTREIGIRLAIGTRGRDVLRQFLIEAMILSVLGGTIGILLGAGVAQLMTHFNKWPTDVTMSSVLAAFLCSAGIGVFFGWYPARQAAQLDPIEALRTE